MTRLYDLPRDKGVKIYGAKDTEGKDVVIIFGHLDGMYSCCWIENKPDKVVHLSANTPLVVYKDGYKLKEE